MRSKLLATLAIGLLLGQGNSLEAVAQTPAEPAAAAKPPDPCKSAVHLGAPKNIFVEYPKTYDDAVLQQQLEANFGRLSALSGLDQASLTSHLGNVSGVDQTFATASFNIQGPSTSQIATTAAIPTSQTVQTNTVSTGTAASNAVSVPVSNNQVNTQTTTSAPTKSTVTTQPSVTVPVSTAPAPAPAVTTGFSVQSSAVLSEQLQLVSRLNTQLLEYEGALSDRMLRYSDGAQQVFAMRPRATVGFDVTVSPTHDERDAVAIVEVIVTNCEQLEDAPPAVTAILPSEQTYNVASVRNTATNLGAGVATQFVGASGSFLFGHNQYFLVQDQDTVAQVFEPSGSDKEHYCSMNCVGVRWIFRPVLGKRFVGPGRRKIVVQMAFPSTQSKDQLGIMTVQTSWRKFDRKTGLVGEPLKGKDSALYRYPVLRYRLNDIKPVLSADSWEDVGGGVVAVRIDDTFLAGTYIAIGTTNLSDLPSGLVRETGAIRFAAPAFDLLTKKSYLVSRSGERAPLIIPRLFPPTEVAAKVIALDATFSRLVVSYCQRFNADASDAALATEFDPFLLVIAGKVYGLSDAPLFRSQVPQHDDVCDQTTPPTAIVQGGPTGQVYERSLAVTIPTSTLLASPTVTMKPMFGDASFASQLSLLDDNFSPLSQSDRLVALKLTKDNGEFLLYGNRLSAVTQVEPPVTLDRIARAAADPDVQDNMRYVTLSSQQLEQYKFLVITRRGEAPEAIPIPTVTLPGSPSAPVITGTVLLNQDSAIVNGNLQDLEKVLFQKAEIKFLFLDKDKKSIRLVGLKKAGVTSSAGLQSLDFIFKAKPVPVKVDVYTQAVQTVARPAPDVKQ